MSLPASSPCHSPSCHDDYYMKEGQLFPSQWQRNWDLRSELAALEIHNLKPEASSSTANYGGAHMAAAPPAFAASAPMPWESAVAAALLPARPDIRASLAPFVPFEPPLPGLGLAGAAAPAAVAAVPFHDDWPLW